jgi:hypothetical protein
MKMLGRDEILGVVDLRFANVEVPEWGGTVRVRGLTGAERDAYEASAVTVVDGKRTMNVRNLRAKLIVMAAVDSTGHPMFTEEDVQRLGAKSGIALERVFDTVRHLSGMTEDDMARLERDLEPGQSSETSTD